MKEHFKWVDRAKAIGMMLVVLGHALADTMLAKNTGNASQILFNIIYSFHMPLFFFLSGFCGAKVLEILDFKQKKQYVFSRFRRLMIPYFFVGLLYIPLKMILTNEVNTQIDVLKLPADFLSGNNPNFQLWTLYAMFIIAIMLCIMGNIGIYKILLISLVLCMISLFFSCPIMIIQQVMYEMFFYVAGIMYRKRFANDTIPNFMFALNLLIFVLANMIKEITGIEQLKFITAVTGIIFICELCKRICVKDAGVLDVVGKYSMDIYIMANLVQVFVRSVFLYKMQVPAFISCIISLLMGIVLPILASKYIVRRVKILKSLVLGEFNK